MQMRPVDSVCVSRKNKAKKRNTKNKKVDTCKGSRWKSDSRWTEAHLAESLLSYRGKF